MSSFPPWMYTPFFFVLQLKFLFILNLVFGFLKVLDLPSIITSHILHRLLLHLVTPCVVFFPNVEEVSILFRFLGCQWPLMIFVVSCISLILSLFLISSRFFIISLSRSGLFLLWRMEAFFRCEIFSGSLILFGVFFLLILTLYSLVLLDTLSGVELCLVLRGVFF